MVDNVMQAGHARYVPVREALEVVPRHIFVPAATADDAYADIAMITNRTSDGAALSCASVPTVVAMMLDQLEVRPATVSSKSAPEPATTPPSSPT